MWRAEGFLRPSANEKRAAETRNAHPSEVLVRGSASVACARPNARPLGRCAGAFSGATAIVGQAAIAGPERQMARFAGHLEHHTIPEAGLWLLLLAVDERRRDDATLLGSQCSLKSGA
jgi:hypothetical protein